MSRPESKKPQSSASKGRRIGAANTLPFGRRNQILFGVGFLVILVGYYLLSKNSITLAPLLLVLGYCILIPLAIMAK